jgi:hypothetical protein
VPRLLLGWMARVCCHVLLFAWCDNYIAFVGSNHIAQDIKTSGLNHDLQANPAYRHTNKKVYLCIHPLLVPTAARITKYLNKYVRTGYSNQGAYRQSYCIYLLSRDMYKHFEVYSIGPVDQVGSKKPLSYRSKLPAVQQLWLNFRPLPSLTVNIYKAETCTNILRYNTCMSSSPGDRKWTKIEP